MANICSVSVRVTSNCKKSLDDFLDSLTYEVFDEDYTDRETDTTAYLGANTNWRPPIDYLLSLSKEFPALLFHLEATEPGTGFNQCADFRAGIMFDLTKRHVRLLKEYCKKMIMALQDADENDKGQYLQLLDDIFEKGLFDITDDNRGNWCRILEFMKHVLSFKQSCLEWIMGLDMSDEDKERYSKKLDPVFKENLPYFDFTVPCSEQNNWKYVKEDMKLPD